MKRLALAALLLVTASACTPKADDNAQNTVQASTQYEIELISASSPITADGYSEEELRYIEWREAEERRFIEWYTASPDNRAYYEWTVSMQDPANAAWFKWKTTPQTSPRVTNDVWWALAGCETGYKYNNPNTGNGYYGYFQFDLPTWQSVGGPGYPHHHSYETQKSFAQKLQARRGWSPWPYCSSKLGLR